VGTVKRYRPARVSPPCRPRPVCESTMRARCGQLRLSRIVCVHSHVRGGARSLTKPRQMRPDCVAERLAER
jgi:hypothetical protein